MDKLTKSANFLDIKANDSMSTLSQLYIKK